MLNASDYGRHRKWLKAPLFVAAVLGMVMTHVPANAHRVNVFAYVEGDSLVVEGYFSKDAKAQDCKLFFFDETGKQIHEGKTDKKGMYSFKLADLPPFSGSLKIVMEAGMGHKADYTLSAEEIPGAVKKNAEPQAKLVVSKSQPEAAPGVSDSKVTGAVPSVDQAALTAALDAALDKKLAPLTRMLGKQEKLLLEEKFGGPKMTDIIGGIGWIVGMVGLAAFFWGRNRSQDGK